MNFCFTYFYIIIIINKYLKYLCIWISYIVYNEYTILYNKINLILSLKNAMKKKILQKSDKISFLRELIE